MKQLYKKKTKQIYEEKTVRQIWAKIEGLSNSKKAINFRYELIPEKNDHISTKKIHLPMKHSR